MNKYMCVMHGVLSAESAWQDNIVWQTNQKYPETQDVARNSHLANGSLTQRNGSRVHSLV